MPRDLLHVHEVGEGGTTMPVVGIFVILVIGLTGSLIPPLVTLYLPKFDLNNRLGFRFFNGLAAGVVLGVAFIHSIPESLGNFEEAFEGREDGPATYAWGGFLSMLGVLATFICEEFVHRRVSRFAALHGHDHGHAHGHAHGHHAHAHYTAGHKEKGIEGSGELDARETRALEDGTITDSSASVTPPPSPSLRPELSAQASNTKDLDVVVAVAEEEPKAPTGGVSEAQIGYYTELYVLLFGLTFHSVFVGLALGVSGDDWGLFAAIIFHQFFEGLALGARVARAGFKSKFHIWILDIVYALAIPVGIAIGIGIQAAITDETTYHVVNGVFQGLSGGVLIYVALIHMMKEEMERPEFRKGGTILYIMYAGFFIGAGCLAVIGIWA